MLLYLGIYLAFLFIVTLLYYTVRNSFKHIVLFSASIGFITFISWKVALYAILFSTINYFWGILIEKNKSNAPLRRRIFWTAIVLDVGFLSFFKYFILLKDGITALLSLFSTSSPWLLSGVIIPLGISYYTFQALGYIIRINRGSEKPEPDFLNFVTFLIFFPKFFSGPVERSNHFFPQIRSLGDFKKDTVYEGLRLFLWGVFKKFAIASILYLPVHQIYSDIHNFTGISLLLVFFLQPIYIYMEFSGYTDMALGSAKIFGINLIDNFNRPFLARNISEYWRRWHISLSSWCTDFIYNPFIVKYRKYENLAVVTGVFLTFFVIGIWHAANWTFVVLGLLQGIAIVYEFYTKKFRLKVASRYPKSRVNAFSRIIVFLFVCVSMVFFFSPSISNAWYFLSHLFDFNSSTITESLTFPNKLAFGLSLLFFALIFVAEMFNEKGKNLLFVFLKQPIWLQWIGYGLLITAICLSNSEFQPFEYMKF
jgi:alginate O-acetyltransferase complex protein AlgI